VGDARGRGSRGWRCRRRRSSGAVADGPAADGAFADGGIGTLSWRGYGARTDKIGKEEGIGEGTMVSKMFSSTGDAEAGHTKGQTDESDCCTKKYLCFSFFSCM